MLARLSKRVSKRASASREDNTASKGEEGSAVEAGTEEAPGASDAGCSQDDAPAHAAAQDDSDDGNDGGGALREEAGQRPAEAGAEAKDLWHALGDAIATGRQHVVDQLMAGNKLGISRMLRSLLPASRGARAASQAAGQAEEGKLDAENEVDESALGEISTRVAFQVCVDGVENVPKPIDSTNIIQGKFAVAVSVLGARDGKKVRTLSTKSAAVEEGSIEFGERLELGMVAPEDTLCFELSTWFLKSPLGTGVKVVVGEVRVLVGDLIAQSVLDKEGSSFAGAALWIKDPDSDIVVFDRAMVNPTQILLSFDMAQLPEADIPVPRGMLSVVVPDLADLEDCADEPPAVSLAGKHPSYTKHVFVVTRGTRGDVQPFIALGRGLAELHGMLVTICTEDRYRPLIERYSDVSRGAVQFRTSGGDTEKRITTALAKWAMQQKSTALQMAMLGHSEREFFDSEPVFHYWCRAMRPDLILFGFTTANVAMVLSESLRIPMIGFLLQPTVIPSKQYPAIAPIEREGDPDLSHRVHGRIKMFMENNPLDFQTSLNAMRSRRGLQPFSHRVDNYQLIVDQDIPCVVPINKTTFGGKPPDWHENAVLTDFIFLRTGAVPNLTARYVKMIMEAKAAGEPLVAMAFSSMPVPRTRILELAIMMIEKCARRPRVIALVGNQNSINPSDADSKVELDEHAQAIEEAARRYMKSGKLLVDAGCPFSKLFPQVDCIIAHGGLGTTGEALRAAKPVITTGVLILDQRFWARRLHDLGVGPAPVHIKDLHKTLVASIDACLDPAGSYAACAKDLAQLIAGEADSDGVEENCTAIVEMMKVSKPVRVHTESIMLSPSRLASALATDANRVVRHEVNFARGHITSFMTQNARELRRRVESVVGSSQAPSTP